MSRHRLSTGRVSRARLQLRGLGTTYDRTFTYDRDGNRRTKTEGAVTFTYTVDRTDQLASVVKTAGVTQDFAYDARGNMTGDAQSGAAVTTYTYDLGNKLTGIDAGGSATTNDATFTFDALGRFATRTLVGPGTADTFGYVGTSETVARIANSGGVVTDSIVSASGDRIGVRVGSTVNWLLPDLHGSTGASLSADETAVTNAIRYDAYGMTLATGKPGASPAPVGEKAWTYQGRLDISPAGLGTPLYDMGARFYAPGIGAFTQLDTVMGSAQDPLSMNRFLYAQANPATLIDPTGHAACSAYADVCPANGSTSKHTVQRHDRTGHREANRGRRTSAQVDADLRARIGKTRTNSRRASAYGESGRFAATRTSPAVARAAAARAAEKAVRDSQATDSRETNNQTQAARRDATRDGLVIGPQTSPPNADVGVAGGCLGLGGGAGAYGSLSLCLVKDVEGSVAVTLTGSRGLVSGEDLTASVGPLVSSARTVSDLAGTSLTAGGSGGPIPLPYVGELSVGADVSFGADSQNHGVVTIVGGVQQSFQKTLGLLPVEGHAALSTTSVLRIDPASFLLDALGIGS